MLMSTEMYSVQYLASRGMELESVTPVIIVGLVYIGRILPEIVFWIEDNCARVLSV